MKKKAVNSWQDVAPVLSSAAEAPVAFARPTANPILSTSRQQANNFY